MNVAKQDLTPSGVLTPSGTERGSPAAFETTVIETNPNQDSVSIDSDRCSRAQELSNRAYTRPRLGQPRIYLAELELIDL